MVVLKFLLCTVVVLCLTESAFGFHRVCIYDVAQRMGIAPLDVPTIDLSLCTHLVIDYAIADYNNGSYEMTTRFPGDTNVYFILTYSKMMNSDLKTLIVLSDSGSGYLEALTADSTNQTTFINSVTAFLTQYGFDGLVLNWEGSSSGFKTLTEGLAAAFQSTGFILTCNVKGPTLDDFNLRYDQNVVQETMMNYDFIVLETLSLIQDFGTVAHHSRRVPRSNATGASLFLNQKAIADYFNFLGIPKSNIVIGISTSGRGFEVVSASGIGSPAVGASPPQQVSFEAGYFAYFEICAKFANNSLTTGRDEGAPYMSGDTVWIGYDDVESIKEKVKWMIEEGYSGAAIYNLNDDDYLQMCNDSKTAFPLTSAVKDAYEESIAPKEYRRVCYFTTWSEIRTGPGRFTVDDIDPSLCTHIIIAFAEISYDSELQPTDMNDTTIYQRVIALKTNNTDLKVLLSVGGWEQASARFSHMVSGPKRRRAFVKSTIDLLRSYGFDGLDLAWLYPAQRRGSAETDKKNFGILVDLLRRTYEEEAQNNSVHCLMLTAAVAAEQEHIDYAYDVKALAKNLDFISIQTFDMHGYWDWMTGHHSQLKAFPWESGPDGNLNMEWAGKYWQMRGVDKDKINIGLATYGRGFELSWYGNNGIGDWVDGPNKKGRFTKEEGFLAYYEICPLIESGDGTVVRQSGVPYYVNDTLWIGYDDETSIEEKVKWLVKEEYGGAMIWSLGLDDFQQMCNGSATKSPLLTSIKDTLTNIANGTILLNVTETTSTFETTTMSSTTTPGPHIDCSVVPLDGPYENPRNNRTFYKCAHDRAFLYWCPGDLVFNDSLKTCDYDTS